MVGTWLCGRTDPADGLLQRVVVPSVPSILVASGSGRLATAHEPGDTSVTLLWTFTGTINYSALGYDIKAASVGTTIATPAGSQPLTGRAPTINWTIGMPSVP